MVSDLLDIPAVILTHLIILRISKEEVLLFNKLSWCRRVSDEVYINERRQENNSLQ